MRHSSSVPRLGDRWSNVLAPAVRVSATGSAIENAWGSKMGNDADQLSIERDALIQIIVKSRYQQGRPPAWVIRQAEDMADDIIGAGFTRTLAHRRSALADGWVNTDVVALSEFREAAHLDCGCGVWA